MGLLLPNEIKNLRQRLGLSQKEICELLQMGEKSWVRWVTGHTRPSRSINVLLRGVKDGKLSIPYLQGLLKPTKIWWNVSRNRQDPLRISSTFEGAQAADYEDLTKAA
jgi:transcriptional regulator with XRE-family HTH domain